MLKVSLSFKYSVIRKICTIRFNDFASPRTHLLESQLGGVYIFILANIVSLILSFSRKQERDNSVVFFFFFFLFFFLFLFFAWTYNSTQIRKKKETRNL